MEEYGVDKAQAVMKKLSNWDEAAHKPRNRNLVTTSQIRKFLTAVNAVSGKVDMAKSQSEGRLTVLPKDIQADIKYLKVKLAYQIGRARGKYGNPVEDFAREADLMKEIDHIGENVQAYEEFARYVEALVAFHKFYGGE